jgi:hypothetical protein
MTIKLLTHTSAYPRNAKPTPNDFLGQPTKQVGSSTLDEELPQVP